MSVDGQTSSTRPTTARRSLEALILLLFSSYLLHSHLSCYLCLEDSSLCLCTLPSRHRRSSTLIGPSFLSMNEPSASAFTISLPTSKPQSGFRYLYEKSTSYSFVNPYVAASLDSKCSAAVKGLFPGSKVPAPPPKPTTPTPPALARCPLTTSLGTGTSSVASTG